MVFKNIKIKNPLKSRLKSTNTKDKPEKRKK